MKSSWPRKCLIRLEAGAPNWLPRAPRCRIRGGKSKRLSAQERKLLERRQAIEPIIGHLKADHRMDCCHLKGETGDRLHAVLCAAGYNIRWLLRMIAKKGIRALLVLLLRLLRRAKAGAISLRPGMMHSQPTLG
jgi:IS5 family transposase